MSWNRCRASSGLLNDWAFLRQWEMDVPCKCHSPKFVISTISIYSNRNDHLNLKWFYFSGNIEINVHQWRKWQFQFTFELTRLTSDKLVPYQCESVKCLSVSTRICSASATKLFRLAVNKKKSFHWNPPELLVGTGLKACKSCLFPQIIDLHFSVGRCCSSSATPLAAAFCRSAALFIIRNLVNWCLFWLSSYIVC